jgi:hypothetical protein
MISSSSSSSLPVDAPVPQPERLDGMPIHAKSKPKFTKAYSFGLVTGLPYIGHSAHNSSSNDQRAHEAGNMGCHSRGPTSSRTSIPPTSKTGSQALQLVWQARVGNVLLLGVLSPAESDDRVDAIRTADRPPSRLSGGRRSPGLWPKQPNQPSAPDRAASAATCHAQPRRPPASSGHRACALHYATHITQRSKINEQKGRYSE